MRPRVHFGCMKPVTPSYVVTSEKMTVWCPTCQRNVNYEATGDPLEKLLSRRLTS